MGAWLTAGEHDLVGIWNAPEEQTMAAFGLGLAKQGNVSTTAMRAFSEDELAQIVVGLP